MRALLMTQKKWWDMNKWTLAQTSPALSNTWRAWISMNPDWSRMYLCRAWYVYQYNLQNPYDISSIPTPSYTLYTWTPQCEDLFFRKDGYVLYILYWDWASIRRYDLSIAWDLSTAVYNNQELSTPNPSWTRWLYITPDWNKIFISSHQSYYKSWMCTLSTARNLTTASSWTQTLSNAGVSCTFWNNGKLYFTQINESTSDLTYRTCTTPYDLSTSSVTWTKNVGRCRACWIWFNNEWTICMMVWGWTSTNYVTKYTL